VTANMEINTARDPAIDLMATVFAKPDLYIAAANAGFKLRHLHYLPSRCREIMRRFAEAFGRTDDWEAVADEFRQRDPGFFRWLDAHATPVDAEHINELVAEVIAAANGSLNGTTGPLSNGGSVGMAYTSSGKAVPEAFAGWTTLTYVDAAGVMCTTMASDGAKIEHRPGTRRIDPETGLEPKPKQRDVNDLRAEHGIDEVRAMFDSAEPGETPHGDKRKPGAASEWPALDMRLLDDDCALPPKLEDDALPAGWESWITTEAAARDCPRDYVAAGLIGAASAWIGNARRIIATSDWSEPVNVWIAIIGVPSAGKTPALRPSIDASRRLERDAEPAWREALAQYKRDAEVAKTLEKNWLESVRTAAKEKTNPPDRPAGAQEPDAPIRPRLVAMDTSTEELQKMLSESPRGLLYVRDELAGWLGALDRYGGHGADRAFFLECWNGGVYVCDRVRYHGDPVRIEHATLAIIGGMVPDRLRETLAGADDGLTARLIYIWPDPVPISSLVDRGDAEAAQRRDTLVMAARALRALPMGVDDHGSPAPRALRLNHDALKLFDEMRRAAMQRSRASHGLSAGWHGKNPGRILRLAVVYELLAWTLRNDAAEPATVSPESVARAGGFLDYAGKMLDRVTAGLALTQADGDVAVIARHLLATRPARFNARAFYKTAGFAWARDTKRLNAALEVLNAAGWLRRPDGGARGRPSSDWDVSPKLTS